MEEFSRLGVVWEKAINQEVRRNWLIQQGAGLKGFRGFM